LYFISHFLNGILSYGILFLPTLHLINQDIIIFSLRSELSVKKSSSKKKLYIPTFLRLATPLETHTLNAHTPMRAYPHLHKQTHTHVHSQTHANIHTHRHTYTRRLHMLSGVVILVLFYSQCMSDFNPLQVPFSSSFKTTRLNWQYKFKNRIMLLIVIKMIRSGALSDLLQQINTHAVICKCDHY